MRPSAVLVRSSSSTRAGHEVAEIVVGGCRRRVECEIVGVHAQVLEHGAVPGGPVAAGAEVRGTGGDQLHRGVRPLHELGGFEGELAVVLGAAVAHLPGAIHLVAESPHLHLPGIASTVLAAQAGHGGVFGGIAVLHPLLGFGPRAGAEVGADVGLGAELLDVVEEFVGAEAVGLDGAPCHFEARRALVARAYAVAPVVVGGEVAAGPA